MKRALIGNGGHADEVESQIGEKMVRFVSDEYFNGEKNLLPLSKLDIDNYEIMIAVGDSLKRYSIYQSLPKKTKFFSFIHKTALILDNNFIISEGSFIGAYSILTTNIKLGEHSILNRSVQVGHDCVIDNFFSAMPGAVLSGNLKIGNCCYMGNNSSIKEKIEICDQVIIGMNACVVSNITKSGVYLGVPAKFKKN
jgi:sugar O-acyltransferase (sialic acid O-acetyltransferase NeuD family)